MLGAVGKLVRVPAAQRVSMHHQHDSQCPFVVLFLVALGTCCNAAAATSPFWHWAVHAGGVIRAE